MPFFCFFSFCQLSDLWRDLERSTPLFQAFTTVLECKRRKKLELQQQLRIARILANTTNKVYKQRNLFTLLCLLPILLCCSYWQSVSEAVGGVRGGCI